MAHNMKADGLVLKASPMGEHHRSLTLLVRGGGLIQPLAYGARSRRSALRGAALPYHRGRAELHHDGVKNRWRLSNFDVEESYDGLRESLNRFYTASSWAEILLASHGFGGDSAELFDLSTDALTLLSTADEGVIEALTVQFLWRFLDMDGVRPDLNHCGRCGASLKEPVFWTTHGLLVDPECADGKKTPLPSALRPWLASSGGPLKEAVHETPPPFVISAAKHWLFIRIQNLLARPLKSLKVLR